VGGVCGRLLCSSSPTTKKEQKEFKLSAVFCKSRQKISELRGLDFDSDFFPKNRLEKQTKKMHPLENPNRIFLNATTIVQVLALKKNCVVSSIG